MKEKVKKLFLGLRFLVIPALITLLIGNYFYTFSGFVAYTETERRACDLLEYVLELKKAGEGEKWRDLSTENKEIMIRYGYQWKEKGERCKSIQRFYLEQGLIILFGIAFVFRKKIIN